MMTKDKNKKEIVETVEAVEKVETTDTVIEMNHDSVSEAEAQANIDKERDLMITKLCAKRAFDQLCMEDGYVSDEETQAIALKKQEDYDNETVGQHFKRQFKEFSLEMKDPTKRMIRSKRAIQIAAIIFRTFILIGLCFVILTPILEKISFALRAPHDITNPQVVWIPATWSVMNIRIAFTYLTLMKDASYANISFLYSISTFFNSFLLSTVTTVIQVIATAIAGYSFARLKFKGNNILFLLVILTLIVPNDSLGISRLLYFTATPFFGINLIGNALAVYIMSAFGMGLRSAIFIYLFRQFFRGVPIELEESAEIDGAGVIRTFWSIMLPNARGAIVTVALFSFVWQYNDYYWAELFKFHDSNVMPLLTTGLASSAETFNSLFSTNFALLVAELGAGIANNAIFYSLILNTAALLMMLPLIIGYFFVQRLFVESIERTGITGM